MNGAEFRKKLKQWMLPIAMIGGVVLHETLDKVSFITPYLIFAMLVITFCKVKPREFKVEHMSWWLLLVQIGGALISYFIIAPFNEVVAQGIMICFLCPTASAAPVVTGMLGGSVSRVTTFSIMSNIAVAIIAPLLFAKFTSTSAEISLPATIDAGLSILKKVAPLLILPMLIAFILQRVTPKLNKAIANHHSVSFYLWAIALFIVVGRAVSFIINEPREEIPSMIIIGIGAAVVCVFQFWIGRKIGAKYGDKVAGAQGLGQKNTILAIWMTLTWLHPLASVGPATYIAWQNIINSAQVYNRGRNCKKI